MAGVEGAGRVYRREGTRHDTTIVGYGETIQRNFSLRLSIMPYTLPHNRRVPQSMWHEQFVALPGVKLLLALQSTLGRRSRRLCELAPAPRVHVQSESLL